MGQTYSLKTITYLFLFFTSITFAQTFTLDTAQAGYTCFGNTGNDYTYDCSATGVNRPVGTFLDTNTTGQQLSAMVINAYIACNGTSELFLNGTSLGIIITSGTGCACQSIASNSNITGVLNVFMTPAIQSAYSIGGNNTISLTALGTTQCFYGADVTVTTGLMGTEDFKFNAVKLYPNPASDKITVNGLEDTTSYTIYNTLGSEITAGTISENGNINLKNFALGVYFLKFKNGKTYKFIKE
ncbi:T9SS type A sorting domain-containing protein [Flavobacterium sp.]|uniref:T9SS type A sorting domain-containing protein n=1 Tax=Flavobacterium sp. TaxID=239 RepID=UPI002604AD0C|nr:T9SS type A sorting domain-containing protein [Flavobacterium sp.]